MARTKTDNKGEEIPGALDRNNYTSRSGRPRGGVVTQRTANPCPPVRFRARPPLLFSFRVSAGGFDPARMRPPLAGTKREKKAATSRIAAQIFHKKTKN